MCGIFGLINSNQTFNSGEIFKSLCLLSESRGKEASGFAVFGENRIKIHKAPNPASKMVKTSLFKKEILSKNLADAFIAIGHSRLVTNGYEHDGKNNQPIARNGYIVVHNGIIVNQQVLWQKYKDEGKATELDSELIPAILNYYQRNGLDLGMSFGELFTQISGMASIGILSTNFDNLILATNNGSLYYINDYRNGFFVFASERHILEKLSSKYKLSYQDKDIVQLIPNNLLSVGLRTKSVTLSRLGEIITNISKFDESPEIISLKD